MNRTPAMRRLCYGAVLVAALASCATVPQAPKTITVETVRYVPIDAALSADCPIPEFTGKTFGDGIEYALTLKGALISCNGKLAAIRAVQGTINGATK